MTTLSKSMPDVQSSHDVRRIPIQKVGIRGVKHPIKVSTNGRTQASVGDWTMTVFLPAHEKGTHMSRFVALLDQYESTELSPEGFVAMAHKMKSLLNTDQADLTVSFPYFIRKIAPVSGVASSLDYRVTWHAHVRQEQSEFELTVVVPVMSLCPCSKAISEYGAHNQRSYITVKLGCQTNLDIDKLIQQIEAQGSCQLWGLLKRPDEKYVTEHSYENPKFVEDLIRDVAVAVQALPDVRYYHIEAENFESIHNHSAYATISSRVNE